MAEQKIISIPFNADEAAAAIKLFDLATKHSGLQVAGDAVHLTVKIQKAFSVLTPEPEPVTS